MEETSQPGNQHPETGEEVQFDGGGRSGIAITGILGGVAIALGFPWIILSQGQALGPKLLTFFVIAALAVGGLVALTSAFFGLVMPRSVGGWRNRWRHGCGHGKGEGDWVDYADFAQWAEPDWANWSPRDWKAWAEKMKEKWKMKPPRD